MAARRALAVAVAVLTSGCSLLFNGGDLHGVKTHDMAIGGGGHGGGGHDLATGGETDLAMARAVDLAAVEPVDMAMVAPRLCGFKRQTISFKASFVPVGARPTMLTSGDFNEDGALDLAVLDSSGAATTGNDMATQTGKIVIVLGDGKGGFIVGGKLSACSHPSAITSGQYRGAHRDLVVGCSDSAGSGGLNTLFRFDGAGNGSFAAPVAILGQTLEVDALATANLDGTGGDDLVVAHLDNVGSNTSTRVFYSTGPSFVAGPTLMAYTCARLSTADVNGDRLPDVIATFNDDAVSVFRTKPAATMPPIAYVESDYYFGDSAISYLWNTTGDLDGDGVPDLILATTRQPSGSLPTGGYAGTLLYSPSLKDYPQVPTLAQLTSNSADDVVVGDFDCDGALDVAAATSGDDRLQILRNDTAGTLTPLSPAITVSSPWDVVVADVNGDHLPDLLVASFATGELAVLLNTSH